METQSNDNINLGDDVIEVLGDGKSGPWSERNESIFIALMDEEVAKGQRQTSCFTKQVWPRFRDKMQTRTGYGYTIDQLRNKYNLFRTIWNKFQALLKETGIGWDPTTNKVSASDDQWERLFKINKYARRFKKKGLPHFQELSRIFGDTSATGAFAHASTKLPSSTDSSENPAPKRKSMDMPGEDDEFFNELDKKVDTAAQKSRKRESYSASLSAALSTFAEASKRKTELLEKRIAQTTSSGNGTSVHKEDEARLHLKETLDALNALDDIDGPTYAKALKMLREDVISREIFLHLPDHRKKDWINNI